MPPALPVDFLADAAWHPVINALSRSMDYCGRKKVSEIECHRLLESQLQAHWLARSRAPQRYNDLLKDFERDRDPLFRDSFELSPIPAFSEDRRRGPRIRGYSDVTQARIFFSGCLQTGCWGRKRNTLLDLPIAELSRLAYYSGPATSFRHCSQRTFPERP